MALEPAGRGRRAVLNKVSDPGEEKNVPSKIVSTVAADQNVQRIGGKWLITSSVATPVTLTK